MVVKADGSKWACSSCLKGHRVSGCNHTDRELTLVPKKGRPVTQCHHCRLERKKRSAHVKCDCGETEKVHHPKEKCIHLREAEERAKAGLHEVLNHDKDAGHLVAVAEEQGCCCHHGGKCTCSLLKKETNDMLLDDIPHGPAVQKPRLESTRSDGSITVFANGHHKPVHRKNNAAHETGMPYKMPLSRSTTDHTLPSAARRSVDSLSLNTNLNIPHAPFSMSTNIDSNAFKSEQHSPTVRETSRSGSLGANFSNIDLNALGLVQTNQSVDSIESNAFPMFDPSSGVDSQDPWSTFPSSDSLVFPNNNPFGAWATTFDASTLVQPALTAGSSCTQSDIDEIPPTDDMYNFTMPSIAEDFDLNDATADGNNVNRRSLPPNFFGNTDFT
ncbi:copper-fist-domain-containing protein, partial [Dissoconium aciculare CBS 342.82]|uniref:Copper-fist-domain-containing protein n=1 Tax=Dissoconium aciculare CBS 342.82 TaxID=1314786 RepID=A0A6J3M6A7_9PEZI